MTRLVSQKTWLLKWAVVMALVLLMVGCASGDEDELVNANDQTTNNQTPDDESDVGVPDEDAGANNHEEPGEDAGANHEEPGEDVGANDGEPCDGVDCADQHCDPDTGQCVDCVTGEHCSDMQVCDPTAQACVECVESTDCAEGVCDPTAQACVECVDTGDCPGSDACDLSDQVCVECVDTPDCVGTDVCDVGEQACVECVDDGDCSGSARCDVGEQVCVDCFDDNDCGGELTCDTAQNVCVGCVVDGDCGSEQVCDDETCVGCVDDGDCGTGFECNLGSQSCDMIGECIGDDHCTSDDVCDTSTYECVECLSDEECEDGLECDLGANECVMVGECVGDTDCAGDDICDTSTYECVECLSDDECDDGLECDLGAKECVMLGECVGDDDCGDDVCDPSTFECVECLGDGDCDGDWLCDEPAQMCVECLGDGDCDGSWVCHDLQLCVECLDDQDCPGGGLCHEDLTACSAPCCDFVSQVAAPDSMANFGGYDVVVNDEGEPMVGIADRENNRVIIAEKSDSGWFTQVADSLDDIDTISYLDIALDADGQPHMIMANQQELTHYWRESGAWQSELLDELDSGAFGHVSIAVDTENKVHMAARISAAEYFYAWQQADGSRGDEQVVFVDGPSGTWMEMDVYSDGQPVLVITDTSASTSDVHVAERTGSGTWLEDQLGQSTSQGATVAIDSNDELWIVATTGLGVAVWNRAGGQWSDESVSVSSGAGEYPGIDVDKFDEPHFVHHGNDQLYYMRRENGTWVEYEAIEFSGSTYPNMAVGPTGQPHVVARHWNDIEIRYYTTED